MEKGYMEKNEMRVKRILNKENLLLLIYFLVFWTNLLENSFFEKTFLYEHSSLCIYTTFSICILILYRKDLKNVWKDFWKNKERYLKIILVGIFLIVIAEVIMGVMIDKMGILSINEEHVQRDIRSKIYGFPVIVILGPIVEEFFFRKNIYEKVRSKNKYLRLLSILFVAIIFAVHHCIKELYGGNFIQLVANLPVFMAGIGYTAVYEKTDNICCPIIVHMILNLIAFQG